MNLFRRWCFCGPLVVIVLRFNLALGSGACDVKSDDGDRKKDEHCTKKVDWRDFDWRAYVGKDWREEVDAQDPTLRFGVNLKRSIEIGAVREVPDNRSAPCVTVP